MLALTLPSKSVCVWRVEDLRILIMGILNLTLLLTSAWVLVWFLAAFCALSSCLLDSNLYFSASALFWSHRICSGICVWIFPCFYGSVFSSGICWGFPVSDGWRSPLWTCVPFHCWASPCEPRFVHWAFSCMSWAFYLLVGRPHSQPVHCSWLGISSALT
jgi:hypothetical protein